MEFEPWPSIARLNKDAIYTEKINGTNSAVVIEPLTVDTSGAFSSTTLVDVDDTVYAVWCQSHNRFITPTDDNFGFANWVLKNAEALVKILGPGRHFGEWWGSGIQGGYGLLKGERRFSLFNVKRWRNTLDWNKGHDMLPELYMVPQIYEGRFSTQIAEQCILQLRELGSMASPGFMKPEGVVVFHTASQTSYKTFLENDLIHKSQQKG